MSKYIPADTSVEAWKVQFDVLRRLGIEGRSRMTAILCENLRGSIEAGVRMRHPEYDEEQVRREVIRRMLGDELFHRVFRDSINE